MVVHEEVLDGLGLKHTGGTKTLNTVQDHCSSLFWITALKAGQRKQISSSIVGQLQSLTIRLEGPISVVEALQLPVVADELCYTLYS